MTNVLQSEGLSISRINQEYVRGDIYKSFNDYCRYAYVNKYLGKFISANIKLNKMKLMRMIADGGKSNASPLLSVVVPIHNVESYLDQCIFSIRMQTLKDMEIILVDDGSSDESLKIISEHARADDRILVIRNYEASGNSGTPRNQALERVTGKYIAFVDSDDWVELDAFALLVKRAEAENADIVSGSGFFREKYDGTCEEVRTKYNGFNPGSDKRESLYLSAHYPIVWFRIYRAEMIRKNKIRFAETKTSADLPFAFKALFVANKIVEVSHSFYHYRFDRPGSTIDRRRGKGAFELFKSYKLIEHFLHKRKAEEAYMPYVILKALGDYTYNGRFISDEYKEEFANLMGRFLLRNKAYISFGDVIGRNWERLVEGLIKRGEESSQLESSEDEEWKCKVSVVMPCHNVEPFLEKSLDSLLRQRLHDIEVIAVNDGSSDGTLAVLERYSSKDRRIRLIDVNKPSGGPGTPRNMALQVVRGEYIGFLDADDWIEEHAFLELYSVAKNGSFDVVSADSFFRHENDDVKQLRINYQEISGGSINKADALKSEYFSNIWNRIYKTKMIRENHIALPRIYLAEDFCFSVVSHLYAEKTAKGGGPYYHYNYNRPKSTTDLRRGERGFQIIDSFYLTLGYFEEYGLLEKYGTHIVPKKINSLWYTYERMSLPLRGDFMAAMKKLYLDVKRYVDKQTLSREEVLRVEQIESS